MSYLQWSFWIIGLGLQYLVLAALLGGAWKRNLPMVVYLACLILTTVADIFAAVTKSNNTRVWYTFFYYAELARQTTLYILVISLMLRVIPVGSLRSSLSRLLIVLAVLFWTASLVIHQQPKIAHWMVPVIRDLSFSSALMTLAVWFILIASEKRDTSLLMIVGALGIQMTGDAIVQSLMQLSSTTSSVGRNLAVLPHFLCLWVWWKAFHYREPQPVPPSGTVSGLLH